MAKTRAAEQAQGITRKRKNVAQIAKMRAEEEQRITRKRNNVARMAKMRA